MLRRRLFAAMLLMIGVIVGVVAWSLDRGQLAGHDGDDDDVAVQQLENVVELELVLGLKDERQQFWEGQIKVNGGELLSSTLVAGARNSEVQDGKFRVRAARRMQGQRQTLVPAAIRLRVSAPAGAMLQVDTSRGNFTLAIDDLPAGQTQTVLEGNASVRKQPAAVRLTGPKTEDDFPAMVRAGDGTIWLAYVEFQPSPPLINERVLAGNFELLEPKGIGDQIRLVRFDGRTWHPPLDVTPPRRDVWRPSIAVDGRGGVWVFWAEKVDGDWEICGRRYQPAAGGQEGKWSPVHRVTQQTGSDFHVVAATDSSGTVWLAWQAWRKDNYEILVATVDAQGKLSDPVNVSKTLGNDWSPAIAADSRGHVYVAWDSYERGNYDVELAAFSDGNLTRFDRRTIAQSPRFEARASLVCDDADRLWIAYEEGDEQWGKDFLSENNYQKVGFDKNPGFALYVNRTVQVRCLDGSALKQPAASLEEAFAGVLTRNKSLPRLAVDGKGGLWLLVRHHPNQGGQGETWHSFALRYDGRRWSKPVQLPNSANLLDNRPALVAFRDGLLAVYSSDDRTRSQDRKQDDLFSFVLPADGKAAEPQLIAATTSAEATVPVVHPHENEDVARLRRFRLDYQGKQLRLLRGEFHRHTEYTSHRDQDGLLEDAWRYALDAGQLDWMGDGDHDNGFGHEYLWWQIQKITDLHHNPPHFVAAMTYERSVNYPDGHRNVMMPRRGIRPLPRGSRESSPEKGTVDTKILYAYLKHFGGICASHTSATNMGTDWRDNDPEVEPVVEIYQGHRHNYEHLGAPRSATAATQIGGFRPAGFVWNALEKGYRLGFQSSSDHVSTHMSYAIVLAEDTSRQAIIDAFKARHCYGATDNILLVVRCGQQLMGDQFKTAEPPTLDIQAYGTAPIAKLHVIRDNKYVYTTEPNEREVHRTYTDKDIQPGKTSYYYVRVEQADGNLAWASPMWITYQP